MGTTGNEQAGQHGIELWSKEARRKQLRRKNFGSSSAYQALEPRQLLAAVVANYSTDFPDAGELTLGWQYSWNAPTNGDPTLGSISDPNTKFEALVYTNRFTSWTPDGDLDPQTNPDSRFLRLSKQGGHPGSSGLTTARETRYSIASYTVQESGFYEIDQSFIGLSPNSSQGITDGVDYRVFVNRNAPVLTGIVQQDARNYFDTPLGFMRKGDTVHVAFGSNARLNFDYFTTDFSVTRDLEREQVVGGYRDDFDVSQYAIEFWLELRLERG